MMKKRTIYFGWLAGLLLLTGCGPADADRAEALLASADSAFQAGQLEKTLLLTDSLDRTYRHEVDCRRRAHVLQDRVHLRQALRNAAYFDSLVVLQQALTDSLRVDFIPSADSAYTGLKVYNHKHQVRWYYPHNNLLLDINERGEMTLVSVYTGSMLKHHMLRVSADDLFAETGDVPEGNAFNYRFNDSEGTPWEYVSFTSQTENGVIAFLHQYAGSRLKVTLQGERSRYVYYLEKSDREALARGYEFAQALRDLYQWRKQARLSKEKAEYLTSKLSGL
ncbi:MAG: hypothetical protein J6Z12_07145 [Paludibacteraceae bacterium]|nr:hypothetical protein [Paludibacteraceae bacterium]